MRRLKPALVLAFLLFCGYQVGFNPVRIWQGLPQMGALLERMLSPDWGYVMEVMDSLLETLQMALVGSILGTVFALPLSLLAAENITPHPAIYRVIRSIMAAVRALPHVFWAAFLVTLFSIGPGAGILALAITSCNLVAKLLSEYIEGLEARELEAIHAVGAGRAALIVYAVLPRIGGRLWSLFFFSLEVNTRASTVLGMVGAGGIGQLLWRDLNFLRYDRLATLILLLFATIALIDIAGWLARRLQLVQLPGLNFKTYRSFRLWSGLKLASGLVALTIALVWGLSLLDMGWERLFLGLEQGTVMVRRMLQPDWTYFYRLRQGLAESFYIAVFATGIGSLAAIPAALMGAGNLWRFQAWPLFNKLLVNLIRTFPSLILAIMFFRGVGPGPLAGALALTIYTSGVLGKLYTDIVESMDSRALLALRATGATSVQVLRFAVLPRVLPDFLAASLYRLESNIRTATILGIIGAGGIGTYLMMNLEARNWERVGLLLGGMIVLVLAVDAFSGIIRKRISTR
ncbi:MAG: phosphonate ABC transporter, permease protein PhnE [Firmicutes bacterium]|nr:phosphonate ABC transporter, permease protein PhnE [Bacillota bacterium]